MASRALQAAAAGALVVACFGCTTASRPQTFGRMPPDSNELSTVLGPVTGVGSRSLTVAASRQMSITMACIGKGELIVAGLLSAGAVLCGSPNGAGSFAGYYWSDVSWVRPGEKIHLRIAADATTIWDIRVDGLPRHCKDGACEWRGLVRATSSCCAPEVTSDGSG